MGITMHQTLLVLEEIMMAYTRIQIGKDIHNPNWYDGIELDGEDELADAIADAKVILKNGGRL